ncbi:MAG: serine/threonine-protein kinase [Sulfuricellaceae bacterium]|nr:serine/threonine-protein kinase [Sulfuricellaceae bacterium]
MGRRKVGRYEVISEIGQGAMGVVYRAVDPLIEREVAIKTINLEAAGDGRAEYEQRFYREAKSAGRLSHPNIVTIYDVGNIDSVAYIAMEFLEGLELRNLIDTDRLQSIERVVKIAARTADGLAYAHKHNVVHRDIKPSNIMIMRNGVVKIMDFGIASMSASSSRTVAGMLMGSPQYMSPEQVESHEVDGRSDIFSLGVVLYEMLTGKPPFRGGSMSELLYNIVHLPHMAPSKLKPGLPRAFDLIIARALAKNPAERYQNAADFAHDLRHYDTLELPEEANPTADAPTVMIVERLDSKPDFSSEAAREVQPVVRQKTEQKSNRLPLLLGLVGGGLLLVAVGASFLDRNPAKEPMHEATMQEPAQPLIERQVSGEPPPVAASGEGVLSLAISPWGEVVVDSKTQGASPPLNQLTLPVGKHLVEIRNADFTPYRVEIEIRAGESVSVRHKF